MKRFAVFGASGCGRGVMPLLRQQLQRIETLPWDLVFVDDSPNNSQINGHSIHTYLEWLKQPADSRQVVLAIANGEVREKLSDRCTKDGVDFIDVKAANAIVMDDVQIGAGCVLCPFVTVTSNIKIGMHFHANLYSYVEHDSIIGDFVTFAPGAKCNGNVVIEDHAYIGAGAILRQGRPGEPLIIGRGAVVGMGAVVTRNVAPGATVVGNPARVMAPKSSS